MFTNVSVLITGRNGASTITSADLHEKLKLELQDELSPRNATAGQQEH